MNITVKTIVSNVQYHLSLRKTKDGIRNRNGRENMNTDERRALKLLRDSGIGITEEDFRGWLFKRPTQNKKPEQIAQEWRSEHS
jgi:hypothetical protein